MLIIQNYLKYIIKMFLFFFTCTCWHRAHEIRVIFRVLRPEPYGMNFFKNVSTVDQWMSSIRTIVWLPEVGTSSISFDSFTWVCEFFDNACVTSILPKRFSLQDSFEQSYEHNYSERFMMFGNTLLEYTSCLTFWSSISLVKNVVPFLRSEDP